MIKIKKSHTITPFNHTPLSSPTITTIFRGFCVLNQT